MRVSRKLAGPVAATLLASLVVVNPVHAATIRNVPADYSSISAAIAASSSGDTVRVAPGSYVDNFTVPAGVTVESSGGPETTSVRGVNFEGPIAIINSGGTVRGLTLKDSGGNVFGGAAQVAGLLEESRVINNKACYLPGIQLNGGTIRNNYFQGNASVCFNPPVVTGPGSIVGNEFADNGHSPPIRLVGGTTLVEGNYFHDGDVVLQTDGGDINTIIRNNLVVATGASIYGLLQLYDWTGPTGPTIVNNTFIQAVGNGPLMMTSGVESSMTIANNVFAGGPGSTLLKCDNLLDPAPNLVSNAFWAPGGLGLSGDCAGLIGTSANISVDPSFVSPADGDYHLRAYSPLIDAGSNGFGVATDFDGDARPLDGNENGVAIVDIGFDESTLALGLSPDSIDFGAVAIFATASRSVTVTNLGSSPITIDDISLAGLADFELISETCPAGTLAVGATCSIQIEFTPVDYNARTAILTVGGPGATGSLEVPLIGYGAHPFTVTPDHFDYPGATVGVAIAGSITIENDGLPTAIHAIVKVGTNVGDVTIGAQTCTAAPIPQGGSCTIPFTYRAQGEGVRSLAINITGEAPFGEVNVPISAYASFATSTVSWSTTTSASPTYSWNGGGALGRTVQSGAQRLHLAYATDRISGVWASDSSTGKRVGVYYVRNTTGTTWSAPIRLNPSTQHAATLGLAAAGSRVYAMWVSQTKWTSYSPTAPRALYVRVNTSHGLSTAWRSPVALTSTTGRVDYPAIAAAGTDAHIAWTDAVTGSVRIASSRDYGVTWTKTTIGSTTISFADGFTAFPTVAANGSTVAVCWLSSVTGTVKCRVSTNRGVSWGTIATVGTQATGYFSVSVRSSRIAVVWTTPNTDIVLRLRVSGVWNSPIVLPNDNSATSTYGARVDLQESNRLAVSWSADYGTQTTLQWRESPNGGALWFASSAISTNPSSRLRNDWPSVSWPTAGTRYVVWNGWTENTTYYRLYLRKGTGTPSTPTSLAIPWEGGGSERVTVEDPLLWQAPSEGP